MEFKSTRVQKLTNMQEEILTAVHRLHTAVQIFSCLLRSQILCTSTFKFLSLPLFLVLLQAIEIQHWYFCVNKLVRKND